MKTLIRFLVFAALISAFSLPAFTASAFAQNGAGTGQEQPDQAKADLYKKFTDNRTSNPQVAYDAGKEYLAKYGTDNDQYVTYIKKWVAKYEAAVRLQTLEQNIRDSKFADAFTLGKQVLAEDPDNLKALANVSWAGLNLATTGQGDATNAEAATYARHTLDLVNQGRGFDANTPLDAKAKDEMVGWLNYALGIFNFKNKPADSINYFIEATKHGGFQKTEPQTYFLLANAYEVSYYNRMAQEYQTKFKTVADEQTPEGKLAKANLNALMDRIIDAYARAINLAGTNAKYAQRKADWMKTLTGYYKYTHNDSDAGLNDLISSIQAKPIPPPYTPITTLPAEAAAPASGATTGSAAPSATPDGTAPAQPVTPAQPANRTNTTTQPSTGRPPSATTSSNSSRTATSSRRPR